MRQTFFLQHELDYTNFASWSAPIRKETVKESAPAAHPPEWSPSSPGFFLLAPLLLPGLRPEKLREKLSRRLPGKASAAKFYGERVHKLYGLVIRCSNTLSPKHGRVPLTFFPWASISGELPPGRHILRAYNCGWRLLFPALRPPPSIWHGGNRRPG